MKFTNTIIFSAFLTMMSAMVEGSSSLRGLSSRDLETIPTVEVYAKQVCVTNDASFNIDWKGYDMDKDDGVVVQQKKAYGWFTTTRKCRYVNEDSPATAQIDDTIRLVIDPKGSGPSKAKFYFKYHPNAGTVEYKCKGSLAVGMNCYMTTTPSPPVKMPDDTSNEPDFEFENYEGAWAFLAMGVKSYKVTSTATWGETEAEEYSNKFGYGFTQNGGIKIGGVTMNAGASQNVEQNAKNTLSVTRGGSQQIESIVDSCDGRLYQWIVRAKKSTSDSTEGVSESKWVCRPKVNGLMLEGPPRCPPELCSDECCECCSDIWIEGDDSASHNFIDERKGGTCVSPLIA